VNVGGRVAVTPVSDLAPLALRTEPHRLKQDRRPLAALVPSTRSSRHPGSDGLTICASPSGLTASMATRGERIEERRDQ